jgi:hypothetical protein
MEMKSKQQNKICGLSKNRIYGFLLPNTYNSPYFFKIVCPKNLLPLPKIFPFWVVPNHIIMIQNQQEFKIQNYNAP